MSTSLFDRLGISNALQLHGDGDSNDNDYFAVVSRNQPTIHDQQDNINQNADIADGHHQQTQRRSSKRKRRRPDEVQVGDININELMADVHQEPQPAPAAAAGAPQPTLRPAMLPEDERDWQFEMQARRQRRQRQQQQQSLLQDPNGNPDDNDDNTNNTINDDDDDDNNNITCELCRVGQLFSSSTSQQHATFETLYARALTRYHEFFVLGLPDKPNSSLVALEYNSTCYEMDQLRKPALGLKKWSAAEVLYHFRNHTRSAYYILQDHIQFLKRSLTQLRRHAVWNVDVSDYERRYVLDTKHMMAWTRFAKLQMDMIKQSELLRTSGGGGSSAGPSMGSGGAGKASQAGRPGGRSQGIQFSNPNRV